MEISLEDAKALVAVNADTGTEPALTDDQVAAIVEQCAILDAAELLPDDEGWTPTYHVELATVLALEARILRAATWVDQASDGSSLAFSQVAAALTREAQQRRARLAWSY